jgi:hypothetical protein
LIIATRDGMKQAAFSSAGACILIIKLYFLMGVKEGNGSEGREWE